MTSKSFPTVTTQVVATGVAHDEYMADYAADFHEWVEGNVIKMAPVHEKHDALTYYLRNLLEHYLEQRPLGITRAAPFTMQLATINRTREPDLQIILNASRARLTPTGMQGPADICIEVVSPESIERDHGEKFREYEQGGVREYWIIDPLHRDTRFYRLDDEAGSYIAYPLSPYTTPLLPDLILDIPTLWTWPLPGPTATLEAVPE